MKKFLPLIGISISAAVFLITASPDKVTSSQALTFSESFNNQAMMNQPNFNISFPTFKPLPTVNFYEQNRFPVATPKKASTPSPAQVTRSKNTPRPTSTPQPAKTSNPTQAPTSISTTTQANNDWTDQIINLVNSERSKVNLPSLKKDNALTNSANTYALQMGKYNFFSHTGNDGSTFVDRDTAAGYNNYRWLGENIAAGQQSPQEVMTDWMNSSGHKKNILNSNAKDIGVGLAKVPGSTYGIYWVQEFGSH